ncbi:uncharacterized protein LOC142340377 [Convolutriloba macropyga]|uniref:uncharacterized protein LOC142340377 n=1 Tax=Convolutriloba macropyga TaxID=536237 RepID=UPI003F527AC5
MTFARAKFLSQRWQYGHYLGSCMRVGSKGSWVFCEDRNFCGYELKLDQAFPKVSTNDLRNLDNERTCELMARGNSVTDPCDEIEVELKRRDDNDCVGVDCLEGEICEDRVGYFVCITSNGVEHENNQCGGADYCWSRFPETGVEESDEEYVEYQMWSCKQSDGKEAAQNSCVGPRMRITKKYIWVQNKLHWYEAQRYCEERHNARMFGELDGSYEQIEFLFSKLGENSMWLGITKAPFTHQWKTLSGIDVTEVLTEMWAPGQPDEPPMNKKILILLLGDVDSLLGDVDNLLGDVDNLWDDMAVLK